MGVMAERRRFSVEEYRRLAAAGILGEDERVELIEGELIEMAPIGSAHASFVGRFTRVLEGLGRYGALLWVQNPIALPDSEPQPDLAILRERADGYERSLPAASDVLLVIEIADASLAYDRDVKLPLYARHGIPEVWLVDVQGRRLELHRDPGDHGYRVTVRPDSGDILSPQQLPQVQVELSALFQASS